MSRPALVLLAALALSACPDAPSYDNFPGQTSSATGSSSGGHGPLPSSTSDGDPHGSTSTTGEPGTSAAGTTSAESTAAPVDEPPTVWLSLSAKSIVEAGTVSLVIGASPNVVEVDLIYRGEILATLAPIDFPYAFEVTSQARCHGEEDLTVVARDAGGLSDSDTRSLTCSLPDSGSPKHSVKLPGQIASMIHAVALLGDGFVAVGVLDGKIAVWRVGPDLQLLPGWPRVLTDWTAIEALTKLESEAVAVTVDLDDTITLAGNTVKSGIKTYYVARLTADGSRIDEVVGLADEEAAGVAVLDGVTVVAGAVRTGVQPPAFDWRVWGYDELTGSPAWTDTVTQGPGEKPDEFNDRSERARAVVVRNGEFLVVGERQFRKLDSQETFVRASWQHYDGTGTRVGELWTSDVSGLNSGHDAANAVVVLANGDFVTSGWVRTKLDQPPKTWSRRFVQEQAMEFRVDQDAGTEARGIAHDREGNFVIASVRTIGGQLDAVAHAFHEWAHPPLWSQPLFDDPQGWDAYTSIVCTAWGACLTGGFVTEDGKLVAFLRLHNP